MTRPDLDDDLIRGRLRDLARDSSQAHLARETDTPQPSLSGYLRSRRIPADFCARIVRALGVNPSWLLTGEGAPYLADITSEVQETGANLLELVEAMNAVARMKLGSLVGHGHRELLRELNTKLLAYDDIKERLDAQVRPVFSRLLDDLTCALTTDSTRAGSLVTACEQVSRFCHDADLQARHEGLRAAVESSRGNREGALEARRRLFQRTLLDPIEPLEVQIVNDSSFVASLFFDCRIQEARRVAQALSALHSDKKHVPSYWLYPFTQGLASAQLGEITHALTQVSDAYPRLPVENRMYDHPNLVLCQLLAGVITIPGVVAAERERLMDDTKAARQGSAYMISRFAVAMLEVGALGDSWREYAQLLADEETDAGDFLSLQLRAVAGELRWTEYRRASVIAQHLESPDRRERFFGAAHAAQVAGLQSHAQTEELVSIAADALAEFEPEEDPPILLRFLHAQNCWRLSPDPLRRERAAAELSAYQRRGYGCLRRIVDEISRGS